MNAVERIDNYSTVVPVEDDDGSVEPEPSWPSQGQIEFQNYYGSYDKELDSVLKDVSVTVSPIFGCSVKLSIICPVSLGF